MKELQQYDGNQLVSWDKCDWKPPMKMSEAITKGATIATPDPTACYFSDETGRACLIGLALVGYVGDFKKACELRYQHGGAWPTLKKLFGADGDFGSPAREAEAAFMFKQRTVEESVRWLESKGL